MSDISKCVGKDCPIKEECYRFTAPINEYWQAWLGDTPHNKENSDNFKCDLFWDYADNITGIDNTVKVLK